MRLPFHDVDRHRRLALFAVISNKLLHTFGDSNVRLIVGKVSLGENRRDAFSLAGEGRLRRNTRTESKCEYKWQEQRERERLETPSSVSFNAPSLSRGISSSLAVHRLKQDRDLRSRVPLHVHDFSRVLRFSSQIERSL